MRIKRSWSALDHTAARSDFRVCTKCLIEKPTSLFQKAKRYRGGFHRQCKECGAKHSRILYLANREKVKNASRQWAMNNPEKYKESLKRWYESNLDKRKADVLKTSYNLSVSDYKGMLHAQQNRCAICDIEFSIEKYRGPHVDHNHACCPGSKSCGKCVRGLVCKQCNCVLGYAKDSKSTLYRASEYLERYEVKQDVA